MKKKVIYVLVVLGIIIGLALFPLLLDWFIFGNSFPSNLSNAEWAGFLGSYSGAIATVLVFGMTIIYTNAQNLESEKKQREVDKENRRLLIMPYIESRYDIVKSGDVERENIRVFNMSGETVNGVKYFLSNMDKHMLGLKNYTTACNLEYKLINAGSGNAVKMKINVNGFKTDFTLLKNETGYLIFMIQYEKNNLPIRLDIKLDYWDIESNGHYEQNEVIRIFQEIDRNDITISTESKEEASCINRYQS